MNKVTIMQFDDQFQLAYLIGDNFDVNAIFDVRSHYGLFSKNSQYDLVEKINSFILKLSYELDSDIKIAVIQLPAHQNFAHLLAELLTMNGSHVVLN